LAPISEKLLPLHAIYKNEPTVPCFFILVQNSSIKKPFKDGLKITIVKNDVVAIL